MNYLKINISDKFKNKYFEEINLEESINENKAMEIFSKINEETLSEKYNKKLILKKEISYFYENNEKANQNLKLYRIIHVKNETFSKLTEFNQFQAKLLSLIPENKRDKAIINVSYKTYFEYEEEYTDLYFEIMYEDIETDVEKDKRIKSMCNSVKKDNIAKSLMKKGFSEELAYNKELQKMFINKKI